MRMASEMLDRKSLVSSFEEGIDTSGKPVFKRYTYSYIKADATPEDLFSTAQAISSLYDGPLSDVSVVATSFLYLFIKLDDSIY
jgi:hypothetical protein